MRIPHLCLMAALLATWPAAAQERPTSPAFGRELAARWCSECHVIDGVGTPTDAAPPFVSIGRKREPDWLRGFLAHPHTGLMPPLDLSLDEIEALVAYIESLDGGGAASTAAGGLAEGMSGDAGLGRELAEVVCSACHGIPGMEPLFEVQGALPFEVLADDPAVTGMALHAFLTSPHPTMPNIVLSREQLNDITAYILSLKDG